MIQNIVHGVNKFIDRQYVGGMIKADSLGEAFTRSAVAWEDCWKQADTAQHG